MNEFLISSPKSGKISFKIHIDNVVATIDFGVPLDLTLIQSHFKDVESRDNFPGIIVSLTKPKATILLFKTGKSVFTGMEHPDDAEVVLKLLMQKLAQIPITFPANPSLHLTNIVAHGSFQAVLNLDQIALELPYSIYEPEVFPGVIFKSQTPSFSALLFSNGKFIITGAKSLQTLEQAAKQLALKLKNKQLLKS